MIEERCHRSGYKTASFDDPRKALAFMERNKDVIDLAIIDKDMPHMKGPELAEELCRFRPDLPIILITGHINKQIENRSINLVLEKPISKNTLIAAVERYIGKE